MVANNIFNKIDVSKCSRHGSCGEPRLSSDLIRSHCVSVRLNNEELRLLNEKRGRHRKGEWLRMASLHKLPTVIPTINLDAWKLLSEISQKLNKLVMHLESKSQSSLLTQTELFAVKRQISELRLNLVTTNLWGASSNEGNAEDKAR